MSNTLRKLVIGSHLFFAREGAVIDEITVSRTAKPDAEPIANWTNIGVVQDFQPKPKTESTDTYAPSPGAYRRDDEVVTSRALDLSFSLVEVSPLFFESILMAGGAIAAAYNPASGTGRIRGWFKCQQYSQDDDLINVLDVYGAATFESEKQGNKLIIPTLNLKVLYSTLQTGNLTF